MRLGGTISNKAVATSSPPSDNDVAETLFRKAHAFSLSNLHLLSSSTRITQKFSGAEESF